MEDVLIEQQKSQLVEVVPKKTSPTTTTALVRPPPNAIVSATTSERNTNVSSSSIINSNNNVNIGNNKLVKAPTTIRVVTMVNNKPIPANVDLIEQSKNQTLKALISGPYSNRKIPLPPPESSISKTLSPMPIVQDKQRAEENISDLAAAAAGSKRLNSSGMVDVSGKQLISPPMVEGLRVVSSDERRLSELKNEIIDLVRTNTASNFPVEENTSSAAANKKLVHELNEKETSMAKSMNKNIGYLESTLSKFQAKKEIINNFLKLKNLLNGTTTTTTANNETNGGGAQMSSKEASNIKKLSMRSLSSSFTNGIGCAPPNGTRTLDAEQMTRINELKVDNSIKRLNLYSSIKSKNLPKVLT